ncbi:uncharacterized protein CLUP02_13398 [Colletotrichum lupini]|uniref:Uncharacterized protein n=1 Tax=Colletotrichum lupini TaxID=145971 RepID=A0A9Q8WM42_9PEZI|nr:uncharacterized protein CLUP02_13398 [Colletotrichum lupini]UQC87877.1 hypothetical protein CLUP02_13398 [Colletotrichum lupini]
MSFAGIPANSPFEATWSRLRFASSRITGSLSHRTACIARSVYRLSQSYITLDPHTESPRD